MKIIEILFAGVLTSLFFFPFEFSAFPGVNTKMMLAVVGLACALARFLKNRSFSIPAELLWLSVIATSVSIVSLLSITLNRTPDTSYAGYIISFAVWLSAAFAVCSAIKGTHGEISVLLCLDYLVAVCVFQCISAIVIDNVTPVRLFVDRYFALDQALLHKVKRLYGIGAALDVAGARFSAVLASMGFFLSDLKGPMKPLRRYLYVLSFLIITVIGNMIARTTLTGSLLGLAVILICFILKPSIPGETRKAASLFSWLSILAVGVTLCITLYNTDPAARKLFRFGFEGFFSLAEKGHWETSSTNKLIQTMIVYPETLHTWIIGDGYFMNSRYDINYLGDATDKGFYMGSDVGYLRFIFYFGILGLIPMMGVIIYAAVICMHRFPDERLLFGLAVLVGLIVWFKVSTDLFLFFAFFLCAGALQNPGPVPQSST